ncbi:hypothetical protein C2S51_018899 [Perilla frutescens var. frutescens]|nr:hypothetical protein C2S51_018899 [Perilla frutescens var. frutescens]
MRRRHIDPNSLTFPFVLKACELLQNSHSLAKALHAQVTKFGFLDDVYVHNALSCSYCRFGDVNGAKGVFEESLFRDAVSYNVMLDGFVKAGEIGGEINHARDLFDEMPSSFRNAVTYNAMIDGFFKAGEMGHARELFNEMPRSFRDAVTYNTMIDGLVKPGDIDHARELFDEMPSSFRNAVTYNTMIDGFFKAGEMGHARELFNEMPRSFRDAVTYGAMVKAGEMGHARELFDEMPRVLFEEIPRSFRNVVSYNVMLDGFVKADQIDYAREVFDEMPSSFRDVVSYATMIDGFCKAGEIELARELFDVMASSFRNVVCYTTMIDGLFKAGEIDHARVLFEEMPRSFRNVVSYNVMLDGFVKVGEIDHARERFHEMPERDAVSWGALWWACAQHGKMAKGKEIHGYIERNGIKLDTFIGTALVDLYAKCGYIEMAKEVFRSCPEKNMALWNTMLKGLAIHGDGGSLLQYLSRMVEDGVQPDGATILIVLFGCSHLGLINYAKRIFVEMESVCGVPREPQHYTCMVDVLAHGGLIKEAREMIEETPMEADAFMWGALLGGCKKHGDVEGAEEAAKHLMQMKPGDSSAYSVLTHIYANSERWDDVVKVHRLKNCRGIKKSPGCSWI